MSFYLDLGTLLPELNIFIFQGLLKLSECVATFRAHLLHPYEDSYYPNYAMVKVPSNLCHAKRGCACNLQHTQLFEYEGSSLFVLPQQKGVGWFQPLKNIFHR